MKYFIFFMIFVFSCSESDGANSYVEKKSKEQDGRFKINIDSKDFSVWSDYPTEKIYKEDAIPSATGEKIDVYCAKNEYEPYQFVITPSKDLNISITITDLNNEITQQIYKADYIYLQNKSDDTSKNGFVTDPLIPIESGTKISLKKDENNVFWILFYVPENAQSKEYDYSIKINNTTIPVTLHVFNFTLPKEILIESQMNFSYQAFLEKYGVSGTGDEYWKYVDLIKSFFAQHKLTPSSVNWPGGLTSNGGGPFIDYNCETKTFTDNDGIWGFDLLAEKYIDGIGFDYKFPSFMVMSFKNNDSSFDQRPDTFCGQTKGEKDWFKSTDANTEYNNVWFEYVKAVQNYLIDKNYINKSYYYVANEPQDQDDYDAVAFYAKLLKQYAPQLKLMVSEEPKEEIYNNEKFPNAKIDIWLPVLNNYNEEMSKEREINNNEVTWIYFLHGTKPPFFNPITIDHSGIEGKLLGWFNWKYRIKGFAYYSLNNWSKNPYTDQMTDNHNGDLFMFYPPSKDNKAIKYGQTNHKLVSSTRLELMRDGLEDYDYLYLLSNKLPKWNETNNADIEANKIIYGTKSYNRNSCSMYKLRKYIGEKLSGTISQIPENITCDLHERAKGEPKNYYINFQDINGKPFANPLIVNGKTYEKIGFNPYDKVLGYGFYGDLTHVMYQYNESESDVLKASVIYDDWGREKTFEYDLPNGKYNVTVSCGWYNKSYKRNKIVIESINFINDEETNPYLVRTKEVEIKDNKLTMEMGIFDEYTMLNYLEIEYVK